MAIEYAMLSKHVGNADGFTLTYRIRTDNHLDGPSSIYNDPKFPFQENDVYSIGNDYNPNAVARPAEIVNVDNSPRFDWIATIEFGEPLPPDNPLLQPPTYEWLFNQSERPLERDATGKPIRNTAGDRFDDIITREDSQPILKVTRNEPAEMLAFGADLRDTVNRDVWRGAPRRTVKFQPPRAVSAYHKDIGIYYQKSYEFKFSDQTWRIVALNQGLREKKDGKVTEIISESERTPIQTPELLDRDGKKLQPGSTPVWLEFDGYPETSFPAFEV